MKRLIDFDALWTSQRLERCPEWARTEYLWCYGLADANGVFEMTNLKALWHRVSPIRPSLSFDVFKDAFNHFHKAGLLYVWKEMGKIWGFWVKSEEGSRLPPLGMRRRYFTYGPKPIKEQLDRYEFEIASSFSHELSDHGIVTRVGLGLGVGLGTKNIPPANIAGDASGENRGSPPNPQPIQPLLLESEISPPAPDMFEVFWDAYPRKLDKSWARKAWSKIPNANDHLADILAGLEGWKKSGLWDDDNFIPYAGKWLNHHHWEAVPTRRVNGSSGKTRSEGALHAEPGKQYPKPKTYTN